MKTKLVVTGKPTPRDSHFLTESGEVFGGTINAALSGQSAGRRFAAYLTPPENEAAKKFVGNFKTAQEAMKAVEKEYEQFLNRREENAMGKKAEKLEKQTTEKKTREGKVYSRKSDAARAAKQDGLEDGEFEVQSKGDGYRYARVAREKPAEVANDLLDEEDLKDPALNGDDGPEEEPAPVSPVAEQSFREAEQAMAKAEQTAVVVKENPVVDQGAPVPRQEAVQVAARAEPTLPPGPAKPPRPLTVEEQYQRDLEEIRARKDVERKAQKEAEVVSAPQAPVEQTAPVAGKPPSAAVRCGACGQTFPDKPAFQKHAEEAHPKKKQKGSEAWLHRSQVESPTKAVWHIADEMIEANPKVTRKEVIAECERRGIAHWTARTQYQTWLTARRESDRNAAAINGGKK